MPAGLDETDPLPATVTDSGIVNRAFTARAEVIATVHRFPEVESQPAQLPNEPPALGVPVSTADDP